MEQGTSMDTATVATDLSSKDDFPSWENGPVQHFSPRHTQGLLCSFIVNSVSGSFFQGAKEVLTYGGCYSFRRDK